MSDPNGPSDEEQIRSLLARLAQAADLCPDEDLDAGYVQLFTADAVWDNSGGSSAVGGFTPIRRGHDEIRAGAIERRRLGWQGPGSRTMHTVLSSDIRIDGDEARVTSCFVFYGADAQGKPELRSIGHYFDTFRRVDGAWKLAHRRNPNAWDPPGAA